MYSTVSGQIVPMLYSM